jgi:ribosomal protein L14E/L6E/L27E
MIGKENEVDMRGNDERQRMKWIDIYPLSIVGAEERGAQGEKFHKVVDGQPKCAGFPLISRTILA